MVCMGGVRSVSEPWSVPPGLLLHIRSCDGYRGEGATASQTNNLPFDQGTMVIPSGRLPSARSRPVGSNREGTLAEDKALCRMSLSMAWRKCQPALK